MRTDLYVVAETLERARAVRELLGAQHAKLRGTRMPESLQGYHDCTFVCADLPDAVANEVLPMIVPGNTVYLLTEVRT